MTAKKITRRTFLRYDSRGRRFNFIEFEYLGSSH